MSNFSFLTPESDSSVTPDPSESRTAELLKQAQDSPFSFGDKQYVPIPDDMDPSHVERLLWLYEYFWLSQRRPPTIDEILGNVDFTMAKVRAITNHEAFRLRLSLRGIYWPKDWLDNAEAEVVSAKLQPIQMVALGILSDPTARGSLKSKLEKIGVSYAQYRNWMNNPEFAKAMSQIGEKMVTDNISTVHTSLVAKAHAGDTQAMKLFYEVSGRHDPMRQQSLDLNRVVALLLEVITRNVTDIGVLKTINDEFTEALTTGQISAAPAGEGAHKYAQEIIDKYSAVEDADVIEE